MKPWLKSGLVLLLSGLGSMAWALNVPGPVVEASWLAQHLAEVQVLDVRPQQKSFTQKPEFEVDKKTGKKFLVELGGHIEGAVPVDNKTVRVTRVIDGLKLNGMLPEPTDFQKLVRSWGVQADRPIVIVSAGMEPIDFNEAARLYWQFKVYGEDNIAVLNGGMAAWIAQAFPVSTAVHPPTEGNWQVRADRSADYLATSQDVLKAQAEQRALIDARDTPSFLGLTKASSVGRFGHLVGARNVPTTLMSTADGDAARLHTAQTYRDIFRMSGVDAQSPAIAYCNTGHQAAGVWFVLHEVLGNRQVLLYDGSLHQWAQEQRPMESVAR